MTSAPAPSDNTRRAAVRRTVWAALGVVALIYLGFFVRAVLLS